MVVKGRKRGKGGRLGKVGKKGVGVGVGKRRLVEKDSMMLEGGYAFELRGKNAKQLIGNLIEKDGGWKNDDVVIMKNGGVEKDTIGGEEGEEIVNLVTEKEEECDVEMGLEGRGDEEMGGLRDSKHATGGSKVRSWKTEFVSAREILGESEKKREKKREEFIVWEDVDEEGGESLVEDWKLRKKIEDKRKKEEGLRRENEGEYDRGRERGMTREEVKEVRGNIKDWLDMVGRVTYVFGLKREEALGYSMDVTMRRLERLSLGLFDRIREMGKEEGNGKEEEERVKWEREERKGELEKLEVVEEGRSYKEVVNGVRVGTKSEEVVELERKKEKEGKHEEERAKKKEEKEVMSLEVVLDSQLERESSWNRSEWEEELGLEKGWLKEIKGRGDRIKVIVSTKEDLERRMEAGKER
ncbi:hypothetical protein HOY80DRAFT_999748 [Tuber brumale]|nr:hypothetical protein HOY80DRAFT_999748 [Tuber brumale]